MTQTFTPGVGRLAADFYQFQALTNTVNGILISEIANGGGFIQVPHDGYNTFHAYPNFISAPSIFFDNTIPSLDTFLNPLFSEIINGNPVPNGYQRISFGGVIFIPAGTYIVKNTINVPPGITIVGEGFGTQIINATSLNTATIPPTPKGSPTPAPVFNILPDNNRNKDDFAVDSTSFFMFARETKILNLVIADNFVLPTTNTDTNYKLPQNLTSAIVLNPPALISQTAGSNLSIENVYFIGRVIFTSGTIVNQITGYPIKLDTSNAAISGTILKINGCFADGFSQIVNWNDGYSSNDFFGMSNSKLRVYGYLNGQSSGDGYNCFANINDCNFTVQNNFLYGNADNVTAGLFLNKTAVNPPIFQNRSKGIISNNQAIINRSSNSVNTSFHFFNVNYASIGHIASFITTILTDNIFEDAVSTVVDGYDGYNTFFVLSVETGNSITATHNLLAQGTFQATGSATLQGAIIVSPTAMLSTPFTIDTTAPNSPVYIYLADSTSSPVTVNLPSPTSGRLITIKDYGGAGGTNHITINGSGNNIDGASSATISTNYGVLRLVCSGINWFSI